MNSTRRRALDVHTLTSYHAEPTAITKHNRPASVADRQLTDTTGAQDHGDRRPEGAAADAEPAQPAARTRLRRRGTAPERVALLTAVTGTGQTWRGRHRAHSRDAAILAA